MGLLISLRLIFTT